MAGVRTSLVLICLPLVLELLVEDFICETLLHIPETPPSGSPQRGFDEPGLARVAHRCIWSAAFRASRPQTRAMTCSDFETSHFKRQTPSG